MRISGAPIRVCGPALLLFVVLALGAAGAEPPKPPPPPPPPPPAASLEEAARLAAQGKSAEALAMAERLVAERPQDVPAARLHEDLMLSAGRRADLLAAYARLEAKPATRGLARYLVARSEPDAAERRKKLESVYTADPKNFWVAYDLVGAAAAAGDLESAERFGRAARDLRPADADVRNVLGNLYIQMGKPKEAEAELTEALRLRPKFAQAHYNLGLLRAAGSKLKEAVELFAKAVEEEPGFAEAHNNMGHCLARLDKADEAIAAYRKAIAAKPDYGAAYNNLAVALYRKNDLWGAWGNLEKAEKCGYAVAESFKRVLSKKLFPEKEPKEKGPEKDKAPALPTAPAGG